MTDTVNNLRIWGRVETTDPAFTKPVKRRGLELTAINPNYLVRRATEVFGPLGTGWGVELVNEKYVEGHTINAETGDRSIIHVAFIRLWYIEAGKEPRHLFHYGQTTFVGSNKYGPFTDEEAPKKSLTDAMNKALSMLGFGADIYSGQWDKDNYQAQAAEIVAEQNREKAEEQQAADAKEYLTWREEILRLVATATNSSELKVLHVEASRKMTRQSDNSGLRALEKAKETAQASIEARKTEGAENE